jgi:hypothetical protein
MERSYHHSCKSGVTSSGVDKAPLRSRAAGGPTDKGCPYTYRVLNFFEGHTGLDYVLVTEGSVLVPYYYTWQ